MVCEPDADGAPPRLNAPALTISVHHWPRPLRSLHGSQLRNVCRELRDHVRLVQGRLHPDQRPVLAG